MKKSFIMALALVLVLGIAIGGTVAWLTATTAKVENTFTTADIDIELIETMQPDGTQTTNTDGSIKPVTNWSAKLVPGSVYKKDPTVTVKAGSEACYLFVKFEETNNPSTYLTYTSTLTTANGWTQGTGDGEGGDGIPTNVWYRKVDAKNTDQSWALLENNQVTVNSNLTKDQMPAASATLTYTAYASQLYKSNITEFSAKEAWDNVNPAN